MREALDERLALGLFLFAYLEHAQLARRARLDTGLVPLARELGLHVGGRVFVVLLLLDLAGVEIRLRIRHGARDEALADLVARDVAALEIRRARVFDDARRRA